NLAISTRTARISMGAHPQLKFCLIFFLFLLSFNFKLHRHIGSSPSRVYFSQVELIMLIFCVGMLQITSASRRSS
ncbi:hypothetical protein B0H13DRAFT_2049864, partial [Mycena leptocephala]